MTSNDAVAVTNNSDSKTTSESITTFDETEQSFGISAYLSPDTAGFSAVVKARYSDFVVHEVGEDGTLAELTDRTVPARTSSSGNDTVSQETHLKEPAPPPKDWATVQEQLATLIDSPETSKQVVTMLQTHNNRQADDNNDDKKEKYVTLPPISDKSKRKEIHHWVRESVSCARADTAEGGQIRIWHARFEKEMPSFKSFGAQDKQQRKKRKQEWPRDRPDFLRFVLYKENMDTTAATKELSRRGSKARIGYAGMKDKRGITSQFCTMFRTTPEQIVSTRQSGGGGNTKQKGYAVVQVGNFEYVSKEMKLGTLRGNRFDIILRNVEMGGESLEKGVNKQALHDAALAMKSRGFINYFGMQRFGKYHDTHKVGVAALQGDYRKAIDILMEPKPDERPDAARGRLEWHSRFENGEKPEEEKEADCAKNVLRSLNRFMTAEIAVMQSLARKPMDYKRAFTCIPKNLRMMYLHAVQSLVWNQAASHRITQMDNQAVVVGDLVRTEPDQTVIVLSASDVASNRYSTEDVVLPLVGTKSQLPQNEVGEHIMELFQELGVSMEMFKRIQDRELAMKGDYRKLLCRPDDFTVAIKEYHDPLQPLLQTDLMKLDGVDIEIQPQKEGEELKIGLVVGFTLPPSAYATIALRELMKRPTSTDYQKGMKV